MHMIAITSLILFSTPCMAHDTAKQKQHTPTKMSESLWDDMFDQIKGEYNEFFSESCVSGPCIMVDDASFFSDTTDVVDALQQIKEHANKLNQLALEGLRSLDAHSLADLEQTLNSIHKQIKDSPNVLESIEKNLKAYEQRLGKLKQYSMKAAPSEDGKAYIVTINMPGFDEKDIKVTISKNTDATKTLLVVAPREPENDNKSKSKKENKKQTSKTIKSTFQSKTTILNGMTQKVEYKDGMVNFTCNIPSKLNEKNYKMTFNKDGVLTISFSTSTSKGEKQNQELKFDKTQN